MLFALEAFSFVSFVPWFLLVQETDLERAVLKLLQASVVLDRVPRLNIDDALL